MKMKVSEENTNTIIKNMRSEGHQSRADYLELIQQQNRELVARIADDREYSLGCIARFERINQHIQKAWLANDSESTEYSIKDWFAWLNESSHIRSETPKQSLAEIEAEIGKKSFLHGVQFVEATALKNHDPIPLGARRRIAEEAAEEYAANIREGK